MLTRAEFDEFSNFTQSKNTFGQHRPLPSSLKAIISSLIIKKIVYYGNYTPKINETVPNVPVSVYWETTFGCSL